MLKSKGELNLAKFDELDEVKLAERSSAKQEIKPVALHPEAEETEQGGAPASAGAQRHKVPHLRIYAAVFAVVCLCVGLSIVLGLWEGGNVGINDLTAKTVTVNINSDPRVVSTNAETVKDLMDELNVRLSANDYMDKKWTDPITDGMNIWIRKCVKVTIQADNYTQVIETQPVSVQRALALAGITVSSIDQVSLPLLQYIYEDTAIEVDRYEVVTETVDEYVDQDEVTRDEYYLVAGARVVISEGSPGINRNTYQVVYENGVEVERTLISTEKVRDPVSRVVGVGPADSTGTATSAMTSTSSGADFYYTNSFTVQATAYTWTGNRTATGTWPTVGTIAVDPNVIPLGTRVYVEGYGFAVAEDTGGAVKSNIIDLYMDTEAECINWGRRYVTIYILD
ncbi:MAG: G5 domain-containing protein [Firmicutes bacterium]|nr:G5 domain-containing protein [Bacillota bacterium]